MKFILNTAVGTHFCALFDTQDHLVDTCEWTNFRRDGREVYTFLEKHTIQDLKLDFLGGVSGPGGFSSLRAGMGILNALAFFQNIPVHHVRADTWMRSLVDSDDFLLNSFSNDVFAVQQGKLTRMTIDEAADTFKNTKLFVGLLPPEKQEKIANRLDVSFENAESVLLSVLEQQEPQKSATPDYAFAPVS